MIFLLISGGFLSPNDSRKDSAADDSAIVQIDLEISWLLQLMIVRIAEMELEMEI